MHFDKSENKLDKLLNKKEANDNHYKVNGGSVLCKGFSVSGLDMGFAKGCIPSIFRIRPPTPLSGGQGPRMLLKHYPFAHCCT